MRKDTFIIILFCTLLIYSCKVISYSTKQSNIFIAYHNNTSNKKSEFVKFNGAYQHILPESYNYPIEYKEGKPTRFIDSPYLDQPLYFFENNFLYYEDRTTTLEKANFWPKSLTPKKDFVYRLGGWGAYKINRDTINAIIYIDFLKSYSGTHDILPCIFQGVFKNRDTISNWHIIEPFPSPKKILGNEGILEKLQKPVNLYFKIIPEKSFIDTNKAWINKIR